MLPPRPVLAAAILLVGGLAWSLASVPPPLASLADASRWEGQSVTLEGWASDVRSGADGARFVLVDGVHAVAVRVSSAPAGGPAPGLGSGLVAGDRVQASGRLSRWQGELRLDVEDAADLRPVAGPPAGHPSLADLAAEPDDWRGRLVLVSGVVEDDRLSDGPRSVALGEGPWPADGPVQARGLLRWDAACLCHRLDAREVWPWTP